MIVRRRHPALILLLMVAACENEPEPLPANATAIESAVDEAEWRAEVAPGNTSAVAGDEGEVQLNR